MNANEAILLWADEYSRMAETYDRLVVPRFEPLAQTVVDLAAPKPGDLFLDAGAGTGLLARLLSPKVLPQSVVAIDLADEAISVGSYRAGDSGIRNIRFEMMDSRNIVYRGKLFDGVVSNLGIPTLGYDRTFAEACRVLKPDGRFVFSDWDPQTVVGWPVPELLDKHATTSPSKTLAQLREARRLAEASEEARALQDPAAVERALRGAGFDRVALHTKSFLTTFAGPDDLLAFVAAWGRPEREFSEMPPEARTALEAELEERLRLRMQPEGIVEMWSVRFYVARP